MNVPAKTVVIFNPPADGTFKALKKAVKKSGVDVKVASPDEYGKALGTICGIRGIPDPILPEDIKHKSVSAISMAADYPELPDTFIVFAFIDDKCLDTILTAIKECGAGPFMYKAVLTPCNMSWSVYKCFEEICREHVSIKRNK